MVKYKQFFNFMFEENKERFQKFMLLCQDYIKDRDTYGEEFNREGREILHIVEFWERKLCKQMESGNKSVYSSNLSDKFREEVRKIFPCFDEIGVKRS